MKEELFQQLAASLKEGGAILRGKKKPARSTTLKWPDAKAVREKLGLSQSQFAALIGISPRTLRNWKQGHLRPEGTRPRPAARRRVPSRSGAGGAASVRMGET